MKEQDFIMLKELYKTRNISKAAENLYITQPALSYRIKNLEEELNITLFKKGGVIEFTEEGEYLIKFSETKLQEYEELRSTLKRIKHSKEGIINIGVSTNFALYRLPDILEQFHNEHPEVRVTIFSGWSRAILQGLMSKEFQVGIITGEYEWFGEKEVISEDPLIIISNEEIKLSELMKKPRINYKPRTSNITGKPPLIPIESIINNWWSENYETASNIIMNIDSIETCKQMVKKNLGFSIIPETALSKSDKFFTKKLTDSKGNHLKRNTYLLYEINTLNSLSVDKFISFIRNI